VLLADMSRLQSDLMRRMLGREPDMAVLAAEENAPLVEAIDATAAQVLIVGAGRGASLGDDEALLRRRPELTVIALSGDGQSAAVTRLAPQRTVLRDISVERLVGAIRTAAHEGVKC